MNNKIRKDQERVGEHKSPLVTIKELSEFLNVPYRTVTKHIREAKKKPVPVFIKRGLRFYKPTELLKWYKAEGWKDDV